MVCARLTSTLPDFLSEIAEFKISLYANEVVSLVKVKPKQTKLLACEAKVKPRQTKLLAYEVKVKSRQTKLLACEVKVKPRQTKLLTCQV